MIQIFKTTYGYNHTKVNYVDDNNLFAGFETDQQCCELATHRIEDSEGNIIEPEYGDVFYDLLFTGELPLEMSDLDDTNMVRIPLINSKNERYYLVFENCHNGYYAHGYEFGKIEIKHSSYV
jgi:hypothetical protein